MIRSSFKAMIPPPLHHLPPFHVPRCRPRAAPPCRRSATFKSPQTRSYLFFLGGGGIQIWPLLRYAHAPAKPPQTDRETCEDTRVTGPPPRQEKKKVEFLTFQETASASSRSEKSGEARVLPLRPARQ